MHFENIYFQIHSKTGLGFHAELIRAERFPVDFILFGCIRYGFHVFSLGCIFITLHFDFLNNFKNKQTSLPGRRSLKIQVSTD